MDPIRLVATDLDGTLVGNPATTRLFMETWADIDERRRPLLCFNSGRLVADAQELITAGQVPTPDFLIGGVGTEIVDVRTHTVLDAYHATLSDDWDRDQVEALLASVPGIERQPDQFQNRLKSSWYLEEADPDQIEGLRARLAESGLSAQLIYSNNRDLDVLPADVDKGRALAWLCKHLDIPTRAVLVAGDRGNDRSMFELPDVRGILVANALPELHEATVGKPIYHSDKYMADGLIDGLAHFGVIDIRPDTVHVTIDDSSDTEMHLLFSDETRQHLTNDQVQLLHDGYEHAIDAIRRNITPLGFSACSLKDNEVVGTDANYRSVWGRDGAITLINTLAIDDPEIAACARTTLETLLFHTTPKGQVPANVRIEDNVPDYSGVGGICAVDSAMWVVIAFYNYVKHTRDLDFLATHFPTVCSIMDWLSALDSNHDGLLEIPEASDWTDLFGRSYNVLYDEVLWYRANVCHGHLLEMLNRCDEAAQTMHHSQFIRGKLLRSFWPSTGRQPDDLSEASFADMQYSLGDARYLLAEVSPFNFNWRCDVFGNILAYLMNVLDVPRARTALSFMWGVGVNEPWPVANLYPVVQAGDPDWKSYYTVNLLNLPNHYHNGGIWPFVGGMWVRFIQRLGQHQVACQELVKLAECNRQGRYHEWEFNEWCHGVTGRPMGKAYQAWSAATFISACHELGVGNATDD